MTPHFMTTHFKQHIANILTGARIVGIPVIIVLMFIDTPVATWWAFGVYAMACITDFLDGYLSRKWGTVTDLGRFLDPVADKLLVAAVLITLMINGTLTVNSTAFGTVFGTLGGSVAMVILFREITVSALREFLAGRHIAVPVTKLAKWKTASQMVALGILVLGDQGMLWGGYIVLIISGVLTVITGYTYVKDSVPHMLKNR